MTWMSRLGHQIMLLKKGNVVPLRTKLRWITDREGVFPGKRTTVFEYMLHFERRRR